MTAYALFAITVLSALACYTIARHRRADAPFWAVMGVLFGPLALPFVLFARPKR